MKLNYFSKRLSTVAHWLTSTLVCAAAVVLLWQGAFFSNTTALAVPLPHILATDAADQVKGAADKVTDKSKEIIRGAEDKVKDAARTNAAKVDRADGDGGIAETKAKRDKNRIEKRAEEDADRTEKTAEKAMGGVKNAVDSIKDAFSK